MTIEDKIEFVFRNNTARYEKKFQKVMQRFFAAQAKEAVSLISKSYFPFDDVVEEVIAPRFGLAGLRTRKRVIKKSDDPFAGWLFKNSKWNKRLRKEGKDFIAEVFEKEGGRIWDSLSYKIDGGLEGSFDVYNPYIDEFLDDYSFKFAQSVNQTTVEAIRTTISSGEQSGFGMREIAELVQEYFEGCKKSRALMIARTETIRASNAGAVESYRQSGVVEGMEWLTASDERACPFCAELNGKIVGLGENYFDLGDKLTVGTGDERMTMVFDYEAVRYPPAHVNCFLPGTKIISPGGFVSGLRATYCGDAVELVFSNGTSLSVTANHLLLTPFGFCPAYMLREGDDILYQINFDRIISGHPYDDGIPTRVEDIVKSLSMSSGMTTVSMPAAAEDIYGDGEFIQSNIDVVLPNSFLSRAFDADFVKHFNQTEFLRTDMHSRWFDFPSLRNFAATLKGMADTTDSIMRGFRQTAPFFFSRLSHTNEHGLASIARLDAKFDQASADNGTRYAKLFSKSFLRDTGFIQTCKVLKVNVFSYHGDVYDLQTFSSLCISNSVLSSNCRCTVVPIIADKYLKPKIVGLSSLVLKRSGHFSHEGRPGLVGGSKLRGGRGVGAVFGAPKKPKGKPTFAQHVDRGFKPPKGYAILDPNNMPKHLKGVYIPPGWKNVVYNLNPNKATIAKGQSEGGDWQYARNPRVVLKREAAKFAKCAKLNKELDSILAANNKNIGKKGMKEHAEALQVIMLLGTRVGGNDTGADVKAYGTLTLEGRHVVKRKDGYHLEFMGKKGQWQDHLVYDKRIEKMLLSRASATGKKGKLFGVSYNAFLTYTKSLSKKTNFTPKDFRTYVGTKRALIEIKKMRASTTRIEYKKSVAVVAKVVSGVLGNTPAIALKSYIDPMVFADWQNGIQ